MVLIHSLCSKLNNVETSITIIIINIIIIILAHAFSSKMDLQSVQTPSNDMGTPLSPTLDIIEIVLLDVYFIISL